MAIAVSARSPIQSPRLDSPSPIQRLRKSRIRSTAASECVGACCSSVTAGSSARSLTGQPYGARSYDFFAAVFLAVFLAVVFLAVDFFAADFFAVFLAPFLAVFFAGPFARRSASSSAARSIVIVDSSSPWRSVALNSPSVT